MSASAPNRRSFVSLKRSVFWLCHDSDKPIGPFTIIFHSCKKMFWNYVFENSNFGNEWELGCISNISVQIGPNHLFTRSSDSIFKTKTKTQSTSCLIVGQLQTRTYFHDSSFWSVLLDECPRRRYGHNKSASMWTFAPWWPNFNHTDPGRPSRSSGCKKPWEVHIWYKRQNKKSLCWNRSEMEYMCPC